LIFVQAVTRFLPGSKSSLTPRVEWKSFGVVIEKPNQRVINRREPDKEEKMTIQATSLASVLAVPSVV
jgi:hypothetical protein